jgi:hypothetical protein
VRFLNNGVELCFENIATERIDGETRAGEMRGKNGSGCEAGALEGAFCGSAEQREWDED